MSQWYSGGSGKEGFRRLLSVAGSGGGGDSRYATFNNVGIAVAVTAMAGIAIVYSDHHGRSFRRRKHLLSYQQWKGVDPSIRADVWPFLNVTFFVLLTIVSLSFCSYGLSSSQEEREITRSQKRKQFEKLRNQCKYLLKRIDDEHSIVEDPDSPTSEDVIAKESSSAVKESPDCKDSHDQVHDQSLHCAYSDNNEKSSDSDSIEEPESRQTSAAIKSRNENDPDKPTNGKSSPSKAGGSKVHRDEDFETRQRIMRLDAVRTNGEWIVGSKDYEHLEPRIVFHAAPTRPFVAYSCHCRDDYEAFWWFVGFNTKARHNFRLDEVGIKDSHIYRHPEKMQAEDCIFARDCFFVYRMVVVLFRRELIFEQAVCLWEVMWALTRQLKLGVTQPGGE
ncbi:hypothetical protein MKW92_037029 [Papaver armeniacum]|nr:hypothetical protein MKW92_037029 [Papaver armeniacum]